MKNSGYRLRNLWTGCLKLAPVWDCKLGAKALDRGVVELRNFLFVILILEKSIITTFQAAGNSLQLI
jgi:hypothetical protein